MSFLIDANVLSEPTRSAPDPRVTGWIEEHEADIVVDPVILGEVRFGILVLPRGRRRTRLERWFADVVRTVNCVAWDATTGLLWAELLARLRSAGKAMPIKDSLIAATALTHDLTIATRNTRDFKAAGVRVFDPFSG